LTPTTVTLTCDAMTHLKRRVSCGPGALVRKGSLLAAVYGFLEAVEASESEILIPTLLVDACGPLDSQELLLVAKMIKSSLLGYRELIDVYMQDSFTATSERLLGGRLATLTLGESLSRGESRVAGETASSGSLKSSASSSASTDSALSSPSCSPTRSSSVAYPSNVPLDINELLTRQNSDSDSNPKVVISNEMLKTSSGPPEAVLPVNNNVACDSSAPTSETSSVCELVISAPENDAIAAARRTVQQIEGLRDSLVDLTAKLHSLIAIYRTCVDKIGKN